MFTADLGGIETRKDGVRNEFATTLAVWQLVIEQLSPQQSSFEAVLWDTGLTPSIPSQWLMSATSASCGSSIVVCICPTTPND
ncbi:MAG: hypothetical protein K6L80_03605 [Agarilytica sp.]